MLMRYIFLLLIGLFACSPVFALATINLIVPANNTNQTTSPVFIFNANSDTNTTMLCYLNITQDVPAIYKYGSVPSGINKVWNTFVEFGLDNYTWNVVCDDITGNYSSGFYRFNMTQTISTTSNQYDTLTTPFADLDNIIGIACLLIGLWGMYHYVLQQGTTKR
jgi:hypothetical protein